MKLEILNQASMKCLFFKLLQHTVQHLAHNGAFVMFILPCSWISTHELLSIQTPNFGPYKVLSPWGDVPLASLSSSFLAVICCDLKLCLSLRTTNTHTH